MIVLEGKHGLDSWRYSSHLLVSLKVRPDLPVFFIADLTDFSDVVSASKRLGCHDSDFERMLSLLPIEERDASEN